MNNVTSYVLANNCEREAVADLLLDLVSLTSMVSFAMDSVGVDINFLIELQRMRGTPISCGVGRRSWDPLEQP